MLQPVHFTSKMVNAYNTLKVLSSYHLTIHPITYISSSPHPIQGKTEHFVQIVNTILLVLLAYGSPMGMDEDTLITLVLEVTVFIFTLVHCDVNHFSWTRRGTTWRLLLQWRSPGRGRASMRPSVATSGPPRGRGHSSSGGLN